MSIYALWCHPRSMSTAVERIMRERGDLQVLHEPFMYAYYLGGDRPKFAGFEPEAGHPIHYGDIRDMIRAQAEAGPVFFKDMGYYVTRTLTRDAAFARQMHHCFLIRDPAESILSYVKRQRDFTSEEVGLEAQWQLYAALVGMGLSPRVLCADDIRRDPARAMAGYWGDAGLPHRADALSWDASVPEGWRSVETWHSEVLQSQAIRPPDTDRDVRAELAALGAPYVGFEAHHRPFYDRLRAVAMHQK